VTLTDSALALLIDTDLNIVQQSRSMFAIVKLLVIITISE